MFHLCAILGRVYVFLFPKVLALEHMPYLWTSICVSLDLFGFLDIYMMYFQVCRILHSFMNLSKMIQRGKQAWTNKFLGCKDVSSMSLTRKGEINSKVHTSKA